jgi:hypothetical protein
MRWSFMAIPTAILMWSEAAIADELPDCRTVRNAAKKMEYRQNSIAILQKQADRRLKSTKFLPSEPRANVQSVRSTPLAVCSA